MDDTAVTHVAIFERLARVEEKIDTLVDRETNNYAKFEAHELRIRDLENSKSRLLGMGAVIAAIAGMFSSKLADTVM